MNDPQNEPLIETLNVKQRLQVKKNLDLHAWYSNKTPDEVLDGRSLDEYSHDISRLPLDDMDVYKCHIARLDNP